MTMLLLLALAVLLGACTNDSATNETLEATEAEKPPQTAVTPDKLVEDKRLYESDQDNSITAFYVTVLPDESGGPNPFDWYRLNSMEGGEYEGTLKAVVQEGSPDGSGPAADGYGYSAKEANATIGLRGNSTRYSAQRSYKIKLDDQGGLWRGQRTLNLNKHSPDPSRVRNKLSFDLFETIPDMAGLRTQFIRLFVKDLSDSRGSAGTGFQDYGLFTHVEQPNKRFLRTHRLDPYGYLYKAEMFEFLRYPDELKAHDDPAYNKAKFETRLSIEGYGEHQKLLGMLDDVNNLSIPINQVMEKHFDLDNYLTWVASNILMDNMDTSSHNFLIYSPLNSNKWYFLPWDYDGGWELERLKGRLSPYATGISYYWGVKLHNRFFRSEENVRLLEAKMNELYQSYINETTVSRLLSRYAPVVQPVMKNYPDIGFLPIQFGRMDEQYRQIASTPARSMQRFKEDLLRPKPFFLGDILQKGDTVTFPWERSFDLQGDDLVYEWTLAKDPAITSVVKRQTTSGTAVQLKSLQPGTYYWKVTVSDGNGHSQIAFDTHVDIEGTKYFGVREVKVN
ncbi:hypothetical protein VN24_11405 [Paenibacillus beijingensis]|uniref:PKD domain-containing protein n=2 Tax=Paenibacillus beijingensis TaxID=1126833 RepID=A0A0D5NRR3_9BACL|nr:hypothetical protein VN24_11405 [Paenibacillus beijingensis]